MSSCQRCGAPITLAAAGPTTCGFCGSENLPPPKEVPVVVPVQVVHNVVQVAGDAAPQPRELRCPHCGKRLVMVRAAEVELNGCSGCGGIWVDNESARRIIAKPERAFVELAALAAQNASGAPPRAPRPTCPTCPAVLDHLETHGVELDICADHGTWFDANELARLTATLRGEPLQAARPMKSGEITCGGCGRVMRADRANLTEEGLRCEWCWRKPVQAYERAVAQAARDQAAGQVLVAVLLGAAGVAAAGGSKT